MPALYLLRRVVGVLLPLSIALTVYLYLYPVFKGCSFAVPVQSGPGDIPTTSPRYGGVFPGSSSSVAPFRLLAFGDPQLEGDTSIVSAQEPLFSFLEDLRSSTTTHESIVGRVDYFWRQIVLLVLDDIPGSLRKWRKEIDLIGNDFYLAHIYRTMHWWTSPTHVSVLGDLLGSQWVSDEEFDRRCSRFWQRVFRGTHKIDRDAAKVEVLGQSPWHSRLINIAGNHDVGYAGDIVGPRIERFERELGEVNWDVRFQVPDPRLGKDDPARGIDESAELRIVVLNSMNLDGPAFDPTLRSQTYDFMNHIIQTSRDVRDKRVATILLTHIPLHKREGVCVDGPYFSYNEDEYGGGISEQNHLSRDASRAILEGLFGMSSNPDAPGSGLGRRGIILDGHDHEGCDVYHFLPRSTDHEEASGWDAVRWENGSSLISQEDTPGIREITVRSMMGDFGGNVGMLSGWYDYNMTTWHFEYGTCALGTQHIWWLVHVLDFLVLAGLLLLAVSWLFSLVPRSLGISSVSTQSYQQLSPYRVASRPTTRPDAMNSVGSVRKRR